MGQHTTWQQWMIPVLSFVFAICWVLFVRFDNKEKINEQAGKYVTKKKITNPAKEYNKEQVKNGKELIDEQEYNKKYYKALYEQRKKHPITAFIYNFVDKIPKEYLDEPINKKVE